MEDDQFSIAKLLHPGLLTVEELRDILKMYCITTDLNLSKDELVDIFKRVAMPLPQRTYGNTWRERLLDKKRSKRKITIEPECSEAKLKKLSLVASTSKNPTDRLKPPPSLTNVKSGDSVKRVVRISSSSSKVETSKKPVEVIKTDTSTTPVNGKHKRIRIDFSDASEKSTPIPRVVSSKRPK